MNIIHNWFIHPLMPLADFFLLISFIRGANVIYQLHNNTKPTNWLTNV